MSRGTAFMWILASLLDPGFLKASSSETAECALRILLKLQKAFFLGGGSLID